ncbi:hypothetical protein O3303_21100 (plasmid) [Hymenobacter canadensis]|uniref:Uncharacterized protein n=1 Tax=Hymenobacter canadensis TaxID=2999067 RepID=A0ABY7LUI3_9BACT|nr:hypothetical protein [Hymenobacter canadensis]WBA44058.1 hypothetical protein O3303_21100 [Hymenobacter canadensis]
MIFHLQPADGGVQRFYIQRGWCGRAGLREDLRRLLAQLQLPAANLCDGQVVARGQFSQRVPLRQGG